MHASDLPLDNGLRQYALCVLTIGYARVVVCLVRMYNGCKAVMMTGLCCSGMAGGVVRFRAGLPGLRGHGAAEQHGCCGHQHHDPGRLPERRGPAVPLPLALHEACHR